MAGESAAIYEGLGRPVMSKQLRSEHKYRVLAAISSIRLFLEGSSLAPSEEPNKSILSFVYMVGPISCFSDELSCALLYRLI
jgi:hypothetical protein